MIPWLAQQFRDRQTRWVVLGLIGFILLLLMFLTVVARFYQEQTRAGFAAEKLIAVRHAQRQAEATVDVAHAMLESQYQSLAGEHRLQTLHGATMARQVERAREVIAAFREGDAQLADLPQRLLAVAPSGGSLWIMDYATPYPLIVGHSGHPDWALQPLVQWTDIRYDYLAVKQQSQGRTVATPFNDFPSIPTLSHAFALPGEQWLVGITLAFPELQPRLLETARDTVRQLTQRQREVGFWIQDRLLPLPKLIAGEEVAPPSLRARLAKRNQEQIALRFTDTRTDTPTLGFGRAFGPGWILGAARPLTDVESTFERKWEAFNQQLRLLLAPVVIVLVALILATGGFAWQAIRRLHQTLAIARQEAEAAHRAKTRFLTTMSHEIRTPMNGVLGMTEILLDTELTDKQRHLVDTIRNSGKTLIGTINDLLDFSKAEAGTVSLGVSDVDLYDVVDDVVELFTVQAQRKGIVIHTHMPPKLPQGLQGDPVRLRQIFSNLMGNAIKFTDHGEITVRLSVLREDPKRARLHAEIVDTGIGMAPATLKNLFRSFSRDQEGAPRHPSGGLGLAISKQLVEMMGGEIGAASVPGHGTRVMFTLRLARTATITSGPVKVNLGDARALVVDDNATNREILGHHLNSWGMRHESATTAEDALCQLQAAAQRGQAFDLALLDYNLPDQNGMALARQIRASAELADTRMVLLSSVADINHREATEAGIAYCFHKPVRQSKLYKTLVNVLRKTPRKTSTPPPSVPSPTAKPEPEIHCHASILLAEDNQINQQVASIMLRGLGCEVEVAENGEKAVQALRQTSHDLVLMDCQMPEMDGFEATQTIRARERDQELARVPIVALTAHSGEGYHDKCIRAGMDDYLAKPFNKEQLTALLKKWLPHRINNLSSPSA